MHDALRQYEPDTIVEDVPDDPPAPAPTIRVVSDDIARSRVPTGDLVMHVRDEDGLWHRRHPVKLQTACGKPWTNWGSHTNQRSGRHIDPPLAPCDCWSKAEQEEAAELQRLSDLATKGNVF